MNVSKDALGLGLDDEGAAAPFDTAERAAPATMRPTTRRTRNVATTLPQRNDVRRRSGVVASRGTRGVTGSVGSSPRGVIPLMLAPDHFVGRWTGRARLRRQPDQKYQTAPNKSVTASP